MNGQEVRKERTRGRSKKERQSANTSRVPIAMIPDIVLLAVTLTAVLFYLKEQSKPAPTPGLVCGANIMKGDILGRTRKERRGELDPIVQEGMLSTSISATPSDKTNGTDRTANWLIENPSNRRRLIHVEISREDTGNTIYETGAILPGNYVEPTPLKVDLPPGRYSCIARLYTYEEEDGTYFGQAAAQIELVLYKDEEEEETGSGKTN